MTQDTLFLQYDFSSNNMLSPEDKNRG